MFIRRMNSSPIFLLILRRDSAMEPVLARRAGRGVVAVIVVERRSSKRDVYEKYSRIRISGPRGQESSASERKQSDEGGLP